MKLKTLKIFIFVFFICFNQVKAFNVIIDTLSIQKGINIVKFDINNKNDVQGILLKELIQNGRFDLLEPLYPSGDLILITSKDSINRLPNYKITEFLTKFFQNFNPIKYRISYLRTKKEKSFIYLTNFLCLYKEQYIDIQLVFYFTDDRLSIIEFR